MNISYIYVVGIKRHSKRISCKLFYSSWMQLHDFQVTFNDINGVLVITDKNDKQLNDC